MLAANKDLKVVTPAGVRTLNASYYKGRVVLDVRDEEGMPTAELIVAPSEWRRLVTWGLDFDLMLEVALEADEG